MEVIGKNEKKIALWNGLGLSTLSCYRITQNELKLCSEESYEGHQVTESNFEQLDFAYWFNGTCQNNRSLVIGDKACFSINGTANTSVMF